MFDYYQVNRSTCACGYTIATSGVANVK